MAVYSKTNKIRKMKQRMKAYEKSNPKMAKKIAGKIEAIKGRKGV